VGGWESAVSMMGLGCGCGLRRQQSKTWWRRWLEQALSFALFIAADKPLQLSFQTTLLPLLEDVNLKASLFSGRKVSRLVEIRLDYIIFHLFVSFTFSSL
jgi:hypothetical protein